MTENNKLDLHSEEDLKLVRVKSLSHLFVFSLVVFILGVLSSEVNDYLSYDREAIEQFQVWRLFSGNLVHLGTNHMLMNLCGYVLAFLLFKERISNMEWYSFLITALAFVGVGIHFFDHNIDNYVGLSGALYGLLIYGAMVNIKDQPILNSALVCFVLYRVWSQQLDSFDIASMYGFIGGNIVVSSHLFGVLASAVALSARLLIRRLFLNLEW